MMFESFFRLDPDRSRVFRKSVSSLFVLFALLGLFGGADEAAAQINLRAQKCILAMNAVGGKINKLQGADVTRCFKFALRSSLPQGQSLDSCAEGDLTGKIARTRGKLDIVEERRCSTTPPFGTAGSAIAGQAAVDSRLLLAEDWFGTDMDAAVVPFSAQFQNAKCQFLAIRRVDRLLLGMLRAYGRCARDAVRSFDSSELSLSDCVLAMDQDRKVVRGQAKLRRELEAPAGKCTDRNQSALFPGDCAGAGDFAGCVGDLADCWSCNYLKAAGGLSVDCDLHDNGAADGSCPAYSAAP